MAFSMYVVICVALLLVMKFVLLKLLDALIQHSLLYTVFKLSQLMIVLLLSRVSTSVCNSVIVKRFSLKSKDQLCEELSDAIEVKLDRT